MNGASGQPAPQRGGNNNLGDVSNIDPEYFAVLGRAPQTALIRLVIEYHNTLLNAGRQEDARRVSFHLQQLVAQQAPRAMDLKGMELLLKDGLLDFLLKINQYLPVNPSQIVRFKNVGFSQTRTIQEHYDTMATTIMMMAIGCFMPQKTAQVDVLKDVTGYLMPGTLTLFLGPRGCGKSTMHKMLGGRLNMAGRSGEVTYNNRTVHEVEVQRLAAVVEEDDHHLPTLSVLETLEIARDFTQYWVSDDYSPELKEIFREALAVGQDPKLGIILSMMGLSRLTNVPAGSDLIPTTTQDQRHRLSSAEMLAGGYQVFCFDELNAGGTSNVLTYEMVQAIQTYARVRRVTVAASLVQPSPEVFDLFDRIILFDQGRVIYQGHRLDAVAHFASLGYLKPAHMEVPEFLVDVASEDGAQYLQSGYARLDLDGFVRAYESSAHFQDVLRVVESPELVEQIYVQGSQPHGIRFGQGPTVSTLAGGSALGHPSAGVTSAVQAGDRVVAVSGKDGALEYTPSLTPAAIEAKLESSPLVRLQLERPYNIPNPDAAAYYERPYVKSVWTECKEITYRHFVTTGRDSFSMISRAATVLLLALFLGTLVLRASHDASSDIQLRRAIFFTTIMTLTVINLGLMPGFFEERTVYYKQVNAKFYRPFSYWFGMFFGGMPYHLLEATVWAVITYFLCGLTLRNSSWPFWVYYLASIYMVILGSSAIRFCAFFCAAFDSANALFGVWLALMMMFAGNLMPRKKIPGYWIWYYYIDPMMWVMTMFEVSEMGSESYSRLCSTVGQANIPGLPPPVLAGMQIAYQGANFPFCIGRSGPNGQIPGPDNTVGHAWQALSQFYSSRGWIAVGIAVLSAWVVIFQIITYLAMAYCRYTPPITEGGIPRSSGEDKDDKPMLDDLEYGSKTVTDSQVPVEAVTLSWHSIDYEFTHPATHQVRSVVKGVSGYAKPGDLLAIVSGEHGGSGFLLDALAFHGVDPMNLAGNVLVNGYPRDPATFTHVAAYAERADSHLPYSTIRESLQFSANLRLGRHFSVEQKQAAVEEALDHMQLRAQADRQVLTLGMGISAEAARRLAIAVEMAASPSVLFVNEPTTGLDTRHAALVVNCLRSYASCGRVVITSISAPTFRMLNKFSSMLILARGETVYFGPVGRDGADVKAYFETIPASPRFPSDVNPPMFALDVVGEGVRERAINTRDYAFEYRISDLNLANYKALEGLRTGAGSLGSELTRVGYTSGIVTQALELISRWQMQYWRNVGYGIGRLMFSVMLGLIFGSLFWQEIYTNNPGYTSRAGQQFEYTTLLGIFNAAGVIPQVSAALAAFKRERKTKAYNIFLFNFAWILAEIPYLAVMVLVFCAIANGMSGLATASVGQFFLYWFILFEDVLAITLLGMWLAVLFPFAPLASTIIPIIISLWIPTGGLVVQKVKIPSWWVWVYWTNPQAYTYNALLSTAFFCDTSVPACKFPKDEHGAPAGPPLTGPPAGCICPILTDSQVFVWDQVKADRSLDHSRVPFTMIILAAYCVFFYLLFGASLRFLKHNK
eukprot:jgi/Mesen1/2849/ME000174S02102